MNSRDDSTVLPLHDNTKEEFTENFCATRKHALVLLVMNPSSHLHTPAEQEAPDSHATPAHGSKIQKLRKLCKCL